MSSSSSVDLAIVGAGAAGIAAGLAARAAGMSFLIVEAMGRVGGRAFTDVGSIGLPWDQGCHWLHSASRNPLVPVADRLGLRYLRGEALALHTGAGWATEAEAEAMAEGYAAGMAAAAQSADDLPLSRLLPAGPPWDGPAATWLMQAYGRAAAEISSADHARYEAQDTHEDWPLQDGYGTLFARLAGGLPVTLDAPVRRVGWGGREVILDTAKGTIRARAAIITASTNVLADGRIGFDPPLPGWKRDALAAAPLGENHKVAIRFAEGALDDAPESAYTLTGDGDGTAFWMRPFGQPVVIGLLGGPLAARLGREESFAYVLAKLTAMLGSGLARRVVGVGQARWCEEPYIGGSYSICRPGEGHRRADIARPLGGRLFFAGEAASLGDFSTAHGAYQSGVDAVAAVRAAWGVA